MKRSEFKRKANSGLERSPMKKHRPKKRPGHDKAMLEACRGEPCYMFMSCECLRSPETVVPAHENMNKGMGLKTPDARTVPACRVCHTDYDMGSRFTREEKRAAWARAFEVWEPLRAMKLGLNKEDE